MSGKLTLTITAGPKAGTEFVFEEHDTLLLGRKNDCKVCHDKLFTQSKAPLNFKASMHKPAEAAKTSCAGCHHAGGQSFETKGNCNKCHVKGKTG